MCKWGTDTKIRIRGEDVFVDSCIADLILKLNELGLHTRASCCGHGKIPTSIIFELDGKLYEMTEIMEEYLGLDGRIHKPKFS